MERGWVNDELFVGESEVVVDDVCGYFWVV